MLKRLKQAWKRDRLGVLGVGSAVLAFLFWIIPVRGVWAALGDEPPYWDFKWQSAGFFDHWASDWLWFSLERLPAIFAFLALAFILLLLRRR